MTLRTYLGKPVRVITLDIESLAYGGDAIARLDDGRAVFVTGGCPGDRVSVELTEEKERFARAVIVDVLEPSPSRVTAPCPYFGVCGGCQWQHVAYSAQLAAKRQAVIDALQRIGGVEDAEQLVAPALASDAEYGYRNKIELVADPASQRVSLGYHRAGSGDVLPVESCLLLPKRLQKAPKALTGALRYATGDSGGDISRVALRVARHTKDLEIAIWTPPGPFPRQAASRTLEQALTATSIVRVLHKGSPKERAVSKVEVLSGRGNWRERLAGYAFNLSAPSFFQTNTALAERLVELVLDVLQPDGSDRVLDAYAGAGTFTLPLAERSGECVAIEAYGPAVRDLRRNLEMNELWAEVIGGDAAREMEALGQFDSAVIDPPRSGLDEAALRALANARPRVVAYVSCDPATLARDARSLHSAGYRLESATPVDMFPQTFHVETVAKFVAESKR